MFNLASRRHQRFMRKQLPRDWSVSTNFPEAKSGQGTTGYSQKRHALIQGPDPRERLLAPTSTSWAGVGHVCNLSRQAMRQLLQAR